jgi:hypothetical protein
VSPSPSQTPPTFRAVVAPFSDWPLSQSARSLNGANPHSLKNCKADTLCVLFIFKLQLLHHVIPICSPGSTDDSRTCENAFRLRRLQTRIPTRAQQQRLRTHRMEKATVTPRNSPLTCLTAWRKRRQCHKVARTLVRSRILYCNLVYWASIRLHKVARA